MSEIHVVTVPISGIFLEGMEELAMVPHEYLAMQQLCPFWETYHST